MSYAAKSVVLDIASNWGDASYVGLRSVEFSLSGVPIPLLAADLTAYATNRFGGADTYPVNVFDTSLSKIGDYDGTGWLGIGAASLRVTCVPDTPIVFDEITINNHHNNGGEVTRGAKDVKITTSTDAITSTVYDEAIANSFVVFDGVFAEHVASNVADDEALTLLPPVVTITTPEIVLTASAESDIQLQLLTPEIPLTAGAESSGVFLGAIITTPEIVLTASAESDIALGIGAPEIVLTASAESDMQLQLLTPEILLTTAAESSVFIGVLIATPEILLTSSAESDIALGIATPEILLTSSAESDIQLQIPTPEIILSAGASSTTPIEFQTGDAIIRYFLTITGAADSTTDVDIPLESFQSRRRSGDPTYLQVVIPSVEFIDYLTDRPNGTMQISQGYEQGGEILQREVIIETSIDNVNTYQGGRNNAIVLIGYTTTTYAPKSAQLEGLTYKGTVSGTTTYRLAEPDIFLNPGDEVTIGEAVFTADVISYVISTNFQQIEIETT